MRSRWQVHGVAAIAMLSLAAGSGLAMAQAPSTDTGTSATPGATETTPRASTSEHESSSHLTKAEKAFMHKAAEGGLAEVELGKLAQQNGGDEAVKSFGQRMVTDHSQANEKLMTLAQNMGVELPTTVSKKDQKALDKLKGKTGESFDKAYARMMRKDHRTDIREFEHEAKHGKNEQLKEFAQTTLPTLKEHLSLAEKELPGSSRTASASGTKKPAER
jgi:putative membrane protein